MADNKLNRQYSSSGSKQGNMSTFEQKAFDSNRKVSFIHPL